jgi:hypothetical protein
MTPPEIFGEWMKRQGQQVFRTSSSFWHEQGPRVFQAFPYHWLITPSEKEITDFLREHQSIGLRYSTPMDTPTGYLSYGYSHRVSKLSCHL